MLSPNYQIIRKDGKEQFVLVPYEDFLDIQERLNDAADLRDLREAIAKEKDAPSVPLEEVERMFADDDQQDAGP